MSVLGHYVSRDDAVCVSCWDPEETCESCDTDNNWSGFKDGENPLVIFSETEADHPTHCCVCHELIPHALTSNGYQYLEEAARANLREALDGRYRKHAVRIVQTWLDQYGHHDINGYIDELHAKLTELIDENEDEEEEEEEGGRLPQTHT